MRSFSWLQIALELLLHSTALSLVPRLSEQAHPGYVLGFGVCSWGLGVWISGWDEELRKSIASTCRRFLITLVVAWIFVLLTFPHAGVLVFTVLVVVQGGLAALRFVGVARPAAALNGGLLALLGAVMQPALAALLLVYLLLLLALRGLAWFEEMRQLAGSPARWRPLVFFLGPTLLFAALLFWNVQRLDFLPQRPPPLAGLPVPRPSSGPIDLSELLWALAQMAGLVLLWFGVRWLLRRWLGIDRPAELPEEADETPQVEEALAPAAAGPSSASSARQRLVAAFLRMLARLRKAGLRPAPGRASPGHQIDCAAARWPGQAELLREGDARFAAARYGRAEVDEPAAQRMEELEKALRLRAGEQGHGPRTGPGRTG